MVQFNSFAPELPPGLTGPFVATSGDYGIDDSRSSRSSSNRGTSGGILDPNMIQILLKQGLYSDVLDFFTNMNTAIDAAYDPSTGQTNLAAYKLLIPQAVQIKNNYEAFMAATDEMRKNGGQDEYAVTPYGEVYVLNPDYEVTGEYLITKSPDEIEQGDVLVTNGVLAKYRLENPKAAFNTDYITSIQNGVGLAKITDYIRQTITGIGSSTQLQEVFSNADGVALQGLQILKNYLSGNPALKQEINIKNSEPQIKAAMQYLTTYIPQTMATILDVHAKMSGTTAPELLKQYVLSKTDVNTTTKTDIVAGASGSGSLDDLKVDPALAFAMGATATDSYVLNPGTSYAFSGIAHVSSITDLKGNITMQDLWDSNFIGSLDLSKATFGGQVIEDATSVLLLDKGIYSVELPIDKEALQQGVIRPEISLCSKMDQLTKAIEHGEVTTPEEINKKCEELGIDDMFKEDGSLNELSYRRFAVINAAVETESTDLDQTVIPGEDNPKAAQAVKMFTTKDYKPKQEDLYTGNLYIPMNDSSNGYENALLKQIQASGTNITVGQTHRFIQQQAQEKVKSRYNYQPTVSWQAFNNQ